MAFCKGWRTAQLNLPGDMTDSSAKTRPQSRRVSVHFPVISSVDGYVVSDEINRGLAQ